MSHTFMNSENDGYATDDPPRDEGWQGQEGQGHLQCEACAAAAISDGKAQSKDRIVTIENSATEIKPFIVQKVSTTEELIQKIYDRFPGLASDALYLRISDTRMGTPRRVSLKGALPDNALDLFVSLHLKKHPGVKIQ